MSTKFIKSMVVIAGICVIGGIGGYAMLKMLPPKPTWLYGHWWYDAPRSEPQDSMWFKPKGLVEFFTEEGKLVKRCRYTMLVENQVTIRCKQKEGAARNIVLRYSDHNGTRDLRDKNGKIYFKQ